MNNIKPFLIRPDSLADFFFLSFSLLPFKNLDQTVSLQKLSDSGDVSEVVSI